MRVLKLAVVCSLSSAIVIACSSTNVGNEQSAVQECTGARVDQYGYCRLPNGRFAAHQCCRVTAYTDYCLFGDEYQDLHYSPNLEIVSESHFDEQSSLSPKKADQFIKAVAAVYADLGPINDLKHAFGNIDSGGVYYSELQDPFDGRHYAMFECRCGELPCGAILTLDTSQVVALIGDDGEIDDCNAYEQELRFDGLEFVALDNLDPLPPNEYVLAGKMSIKGLAQGAMLPKSALGKILDFAHVTFGNPCDGLLSGDEAGFWTVEPDSYIQDLYQCLEENCDQVLTAEQIAALEKEFTTHAEDDTYYLYNTGLADEACGGTGWGDATIIFNRVDQTVLFIVTVVYAE